MHETALASPNSAPMKCLGGENTGYELAGCS